MRKQDARDLVHRFVAHRSVDENDSTAGEIALPEFEEFASAGGIVGAVEIYGGVLGEAFQAAWPAHICDTAFDVLIFDTEFAAF